MYNDVRNQTRSQWESVLFLSEHLQDSCDLRILPFMGWLSIWVSDKGQRWDMTVTVQWYTVLQKPGSMREWLSAPYSHYPCSLWCWYPGKQGSFHSQLSSQLLYDGVCLSPWLTSSQVTSSHHSWFLYSSRKDAISHYFLEMLLCYRNLQSINKLVFLLFVALVQVCSCALELEHAPVRVNVLVVVKQKRLGFNTRLCNTNLVF